MDDDAFFRPYKVGVVQKLSLSILVLLLASVLAGCGAYEVPPTTHIEVIEDAQGVARPYADEWLDAHFALQSMLKDLDNGSWDRKTGQECLDRMVAALEGLEGLDLPVGGIRSQLPGMREYANDLKGFIAAMDDGDMDKVNEILEYIVD